MIGHRDFGSGPRRRWRSSLRSVDEPTAVVVYRWVLAVASLPSCIGAYYLVIVGDEFRFLQWTVLSFGLMALLAPYGAVRQWRGNIDAWLASDDPPPKWPYSRDRWHGFQRLGFLAHVLGVPTLASVGVFMLIEEHGWPWSEDELGPWFTVGRNVTFTLFAVSMVLTFSLVFLAMPKWLVPPWLRDRGHDISRFDTY